MEISTDKFELPNEKKGSFPSTPQDVITNSNPDKSQEANGIYPKEGETKSTSVEVSADPDNKSSHPVKWRMLSIHITGFIDKETRPPCKHFAPSHHNHVALTQKSVQITHKGNQYDAHTITIYQESLHDVICQLKHKDFKDYDKTAVALLRDICQGIRELHRQDFYLGEFNEHTIIFSCDKSKIVTTDGTNSMLAQATVEADFLCLARVFFFVLSKDGELNTQSCITLDQLKFGEKELAKDIIETLIHSALKMLKGTNQSPSEKQSITDILEHPFFWSDLQKLTFVCDAFDLANEKDRTFQEKLNKRAIEESVVPEDWFEEMRLRSTEITAIRGNMKKSKNKKYKSIQKYIVRQYAMNKCANSFQCFYYDKNSESKLVPIKALKWSDFQDQEQNSDEIFAAASDKFGSRTIHIDGGFVIEKKEAANQCELKVENGKGGPKSEVLQQQGVQIPIKRSFFELLQFFRNQQCHFLETKELIRLCFQGQTTGYWNFFSARFPKLLPFIYSERHDLFSGIRSARTHCELDGNLITEVLNAAHSHPVRNAA